MAFYLVKNQEFQLSSEGKLNTDDDYCYRTIKLPICVKPAEDATKSLSAKNCDYLRDLLDDADEARLPPRVSGQQPEQAEEFNAASNWTLAVTIGIACKSATGHRDCLSITADNESNFLGNIKRFLQKYRFRLMLKISWSPLLIAVNDSIMAICVDNNSVETDLGQISSHDGVKFTVLETFKRKNWHPRAKCTYKGVITISCKLTSSVYSLSSNFADNKPSVCRQILDEKLNSDTVIIGKDQVFVKCHGAFLSAQSSVLQTTFSGENSVKPAICTVAMPDMTEEGVKALLSHLYLQNDDKAKEQCGIALELLQAGYKYDIPSLKKFMEFILLNRSVHWYKVDVALKLFVFARSLPQGEALKIKAMQVMKQNADSLLRLSSYTQLFKDNPVAAMELYKYAL